MISGRIEVNLFTQIHLIHEEKFRQGPCEFYEILQDTIFTEQIQGDEAEIYLSYS